jgi:predicted Zn-dependent protease
MKLLPLLFVFIYTSGCATMSNSRALKDSSLDSLRYESLSRYNLKRLNALKSKDSEIKLCHMGQISKALDLLKNKMDQNKNNPLYWNHLATCNFLANKVSVAKFYYDIALKTAQNKKDIKAIVLNNLGLYFLKVNKPYMAKESFQKSIAINSHYKTPKYNLAQVYSRFSQFDKATSILEKLFMENPKDIDFIYGLGHIKLMQTKYAEATKYFSKIPKEFLSRDDIATNYAISLFFQGDSKTAYTIVKNADMSDSYYITAQTQLIKKIERSKN